jgi:DNA-nicking Smr family endonuclease
MTTTSGRGKRGPARTGQAQRARGPLEQRPLDQRPFESALGPRSEIAERVRSATKTPNAMTRPEHARSGQAPRSADSHSTKPTTDQEYFASLMHGVAPLSGARARAELVRSTGEEPLPTLPPASAVAPDLASALLGDALRFDVLDDGTTLEGRRMDADPRELRRLRQRRYPIDGSLDLHGKNAANARRSVEEFVRRRRQQGDRAVLLVHGRGSHSPGGTSVLRGELAAWLSQGSVARDVLAFASVPDASGAHGALFVLLAKR